MRLEGQVAVVTGASSGIGRGIALRFAEAGAAVVVADIRRDPKPAEHADGEDDRPTDALVRDRGGEARFVETDVGDPTQCEALIDETLEACGRLDVVVNNAGIHVPGTAEELDDADWQRVLDVNLSGTFFVAKYALSHLRETEGAVINVGSVQGEEGGSSPPYAASKAGIANLTRELATEYGDDNVRVNALAPGAVRTANWNHHDEDDLAAAREQTLLPRFGEPSDVADAALFLASDEADWITGETLFVDGGWSAHR